MHKYTDTLVNTHFSHIICIQLTINKCQKPTEIKHSVNYDDFRMFTDEGFRRRPKRLKQIFVTIWLVFSRTLSMY